MAFCARFLLSTRFSVFKSVGALCALTRCYSARRETWTNFKYPPGQNFVFTWIISQCCLTAISQMGEDFDGLAATEDNTNAPDSARANAEEDIGARIRRGSVFDIDV